MNSGLDYTGMQEFLMSVHTTVSPGFLSTDLQCTTLLLLVDVLTNSWTAINKLRINSW